MGGCCPDRDDPAFQGKLKLLALLCVIVLGIFFWLSLHSSAHSQMRAGLPVVQRFSHPAFQYIDRIKIHHHIAYLRSIASHEDHTALPMPRRDLDRG